MCIIPDQKMGWLDSLRTDLSSRHFIDFLIDGVRSGKTKTFQDRFFAMLEGQLIMKLESMNFTFESKDDFYSFCKTRIYSIGFDDFPSRHELRLDCNGHPSTGIFLLSYHLESKVDLSDPQNLKGSMEFCIKQ